MSEDDPKAEDLIMDMWVGAETTRCDGKITGYCNLMYILFQKPQKIEDKCTPKIFIKKTQKQMFKKNAPGIKHPHIMCITLGNPGWLDPMSVRSNIGPG